MLPEESNCQHSQPLEMSVTDEEGYLSSHASLKTGCGDTYTVWSLKAGSGQKINITLIDFTSGSVNQSTITDDHKCVVYATIRDSSNMFYHTICGGTGERFVPVFASTSNTVEIRLTNKDPQGSFLLKFVGKARVPWPWLLIN